MNEELEDMITLMGLSCIGGKITMNEELLEKIAKESQKADKIVVNGVTYVREDCVDSVDSEFKDDKPRLNPDDFYLEYDEHSRFVKVKYKKEAFSNHIGYFELKKGGRFHACNGVNESFGFDLDDNRKIKIDRMDKPERESEDDESKKDKLKFDVDKFTLDKDLTSCKRIALKYDGFFIFTLDEKGLTRVRWLSSNRMPLAIDDKGRVKLDEPEGGELK